jgi:putative spermidine/putrescine transport system substrate-binding protein
MRLSRLWSTVVVAVVVVACSGGGATPKPPTAAPPATQPPATQPPATQPPATQPPASSGATEPPATSSGESTSPATPGAQPSGVPTEVGPGEGALTILNWPGYVEDGSTDPAYDWVHPFQEQTGCQVTFQNFGTSDEAFSLFTTNPTEYDVISASGDASKRLALAGYVQPVNVDLVPNYADIYSSLKDQPYNTFDGVHYGIPHGRGANQLMWRTDATDPQTRWDQEMFNPDTALNLTVYDAPIYIADAAVELMNTQPDLGITNPYALDDTQFQAAIDLLTAQRPHVETYWTDYVASMDSFRNGDVDLGTTWQVIANLLQAEDPPVPVDIVNPEEGATGWSDTWMVNSTTQHINCAYMWLNYVVSPEVNGQIAYWFGEAPGNSKSCDFIASAEGYGDATHCDIFHAGDDDPFWDNIWYWQTPEAACVDGRTDVQCKDFDDWSDAWLNLKG